jgi:hypothetical protein
MRKSLPNILVWCGGKIKIVSRFRSYKIGVNKQKKASFSFLIKRKKEAQKGIIP